MIKMTPKLVDEVVSEVAGPDVIPLVKALKNKKNVSEFQLADNIKKEINLTRNMLYRLHNANLVSFIRKKDKKKGWYIYYWTFNQPRIKDLFKEIKKRKLTFLKERLKREKNVHYFSCGESCVRLDFEQATDFEYKCPECGELLNQEDNKKIVIKIEKDVIALEKTVKKFKK